jgi:RNA polymerase sigma-70 factor (ECF subfamily)
MNDSTDQSAKLMLRFKNGEEDCFARLVERHKQQVFAFAFRFLGNAEQAEDAAQEVFMKVYHARESYTVKAKFSTWLFAVTRNTCINLSAKKTADVSLDTADGDAEPPQLPDTRDLPPPEALQKRELARAVGKALAGLPENQRTALLLCRYD